VLDYFLVIVKIRLGLPAQVEETPGTFRSLLAHPGSHVAIAARIVTVEDQQSLV